MKNEARRLFIIVIGNIIEAAGSALFVVSAGFITGGATGLALILSRFTPFTVSAWVTILSVFFLLLGLVILGKEFFLHSLACSILYPLFFQLFTMLNDKIGLITENPALNTVCAIMCYGIGIGMIMSEGASTGALDTVAVLLNRKAGVSMSLSLNVIEYLTLLPQVFYTARENVLCGILIIIGYTLLVDNVIARGKSMIQMEIISPEYEKINQTILTRFNRGTTLIHIEGGYKRGEAYEVQTVVRPRELFAIKMAVLEIDPTAFVVVGNVSEVNGRGFTLKKEG